MMLFPIFPITQLMDERRETLQRSDYFTLELMQPKLTVSQPGDVDEQEADRVADEVVAGIAGPVPHVTAATSPSDSPSPKRKAEESPQTKAAPDHGASATPTVQNQTPLRLAGGQPLAKPEKAFF